PWAIRAYRDPLRATAFGVTRSDPRTASRTVVFGWQRACMKLTGATSRRQFTFRPAVTRSTPIWARRAARGLISRATLSLRGVLRLACWLDEPTQRIRKR